MIKPISDFGIYVARLTGFPLMAGIAAVSLLSACNKTPEGVLDREEMASLMADMHMAEAVIDFNFGDFPSDSARQAFKQSVYLNHGVDSETVDSSLTWYGHHIEEYIKVYDRTIEILEERKDEYASANNAQIAVAGDSVHVWTGPGHIAVSPAMESRLISFNITPDSTWQNGDIYTLTYKAISTMKALQARLLVDYTDGSTQYTDEPVTQAAVKSLKLQVDSTRQPERIYGYISFPNDDALTYELDSILLTRVRAALDPDGYFPVRKFDFGKDVASEPTLGSLDNEELGEDGISESEDAGATAARRGISVASHERHGAEAQHRDLPAPSTDRKQSEHRQNASTHQMSATERRNNAAKRQSAMPARKSAQPALQRQAAPAKQMPAKDSPQKK